MLEESLNNRRIARGTFEEGKGDVCNSLWQGNGRDHLGGHGWPLSQMLSGFGWALQLCAGDFTTPGTQMLQEHRSHVCERNIMLLKHDWQSLMLKGMYFLRKNPSGCLISDTQERNIATSSETN